jgi:hypothetical protein
LIHQIKSSASKLLVLQPDQSSIFFFGCRGHVWASSINSVQYVITPQTADKMSENATADPPSWATWNELLKWAPFKIDALGLVTLLGAEQVNASVGRLVRSVYFEYFPLLGAFVIAGNTFRSKEAGFNLYNITQGIHTTDMAAWLTRWMQSQDFEANRSVVRWTYQKRELTVWEHLASFAPSFAANGMLIAMTVLSYDWYGFANAIAMIGSVLVRWYMVNSIRGAIDTRVQDAYKRSQQDPSETSYEDALKRWHEKQKQSKALPNGSDTESKDPTRKPHRLEYGWNGTEPAKVLIIMNDAKAVTMMVPRDLLAPPSVFIFNLEPPNRLLYGIARWLGWITFAVQVVTIGMADLATQIVTVFLLVFPTILFIARLGCDDSRWWSKSKEIFGSIAHGNGKNPGVDDERYYWPELQSECWIGSYLKAEVYEWPWSHEFAMDKDGFVRDDAQYESAERPISKRQHLYAWLQLSDDEKASMDKWDLFPHERGNNKKWIDLYGMMTRRTKQLQKRQWGVNSLRGAPPKPTQTTGPDDVKPRKPSQTPVLDTKMARQQVAKQNKEQQEDTVDTAQDGTVLEHNSPSIRTSPATIAPYPTEHCTSVAFPSSHQDADNIRPLRKSHTDPVRARQHSVTPAESGGSAFWVTNRLVEQQEESSEEVCESEESDDIKATKKSD